MAQYKLIQDIEAEDKILGPLTLRQFIFGLVAAFLAYICFILIVKHIFFLLVLFLPPALFCAFFAVPFGQDQPTEVWFLAKIRFWFKPRRRLWNQSGVKELVTITVPKKVERVLTKGFSQTEVNSRLKALAATLDSRGWAVKHSSQAVAYTQPVIGSDSDRLIDIDSLPSNVPNDDIAPGDDMLDETNNPIARQFETMIDESSRSRRQQLMDELNDVREDQAAGQEAAASSNWFMGQAHQDQGPPQPAQVTGPATAAAADDSELTASLASRANLRQVSFGNLRTVKPLSSQAPAAAVIASDGPVPTDDQAAADSPATAVTAPGDPAILSLAKNDDFNVATLAREAKKTRGDEGQPPDEVVVSLH